MFFTCICAFGQDLSYMRSVIDTLSSREMFGRAYSKNGAKKASLYIANEYECMGIQPVSSSSFFQTLKYPTTDFRKMPKVCLDCKELIPAVDFIVTKASKSVKGTFSIVPFLNDSVKDELVKMKVMMNGDKNKVILTDSFHPELKNMGRMTYGGTVFVNNSNRVTWAMSDAKAMKRTFTIYMPKGVITADAKKMYVSIKNKKIRNFHTRNVVGVISGTSEKEDYFMIGAHYDHLGGFGDNIYMPGTNDNASGVAMMLSIAKYLKDNNISLQHSLLLVAFAGEEAGLIGSTYFAEHPPVALNKVDFFINLDMVGGGADGITIVNGTSYKNEINLLKEINDKNDYVPEILLRGPSDNSDHAPLNAKGVPSIFIYTRGSNLKEYHTIYDNSRNFPLDKSGELIRLIVDFLVELDKK